MNNGAFNPGRVSPPISDDRIEMAQALARGTVRMDGSPAPVVSLLELQARVEALEREVRVMMRSRRR